MLSLASFVLQFCCVPLSMFLSNRKPVNVCACLHTIWCELVYAVRGALGMRTE